MFIKLFRLITICLNEMFGKVCVYKHLCGKFPIHNEEDALRSLIFNPSLEYVRWVKENKKI
jgi:hypothetical protein